MLVNIPRTCVLQIGNGVAYLGFPITVFLFWKDLKHHKTKEPSTVFLAGGILNYFCQGHCYFK